VERGLGKRKYRPQNRSSDVSGKKSPESGRPRGGKSAAKICMGLKKSGKRLDIFTERRVFVNTLGGNTERGQGGGQGTGSTVPEKGKEVNSRKSS